MTEAQGDLVRIADVVRELGAARAAIARRTLPADPLTALMKTDPPWRHELTLFGLSEPISMPLKSTSVASQTRPGIGR